MPDNIKYVSCSGCHMHGFGANTSIIAEITFSTKPHGNLQIRYTEFVDKYNHNTVTAKLSSTSTLSVTALDAKKRSYMELIGALIVRLTFHQIYTPPHN